MRRTGLAALLTMSWVVLMLLLFDHEYKGPPRFTPELDLSSPILALELARVPKDVDAVLQRTSVPQDPNHVERAIHALWLNTVLDLGFIPLYCAYLLSLARLFGGRRTGLVAAILGAAFFDYVEDVFIFQALAGHAPHQFLPSLIKWALLGVVFTSLGVQMLRAGAGVYSFATRALLGFAHVAAGALVLLAVAFGGRYPLLPVLWPTIGYSWLPLGNGIFAITVLVNVMGLLGPTVAEWFPGGTITYVEDFCAKRARGTAFSPVVETPPKDS
jgi:hypothetical protein